MTDHRCRTCRWWDARHPTDGWGYCELAEMHYHSENDHHMLHPESKARAQDGSDYHAALVTSPDFGCVQWEPKP